MPARRQVRLLVPLAQGAEHPAQLAERLAAGLLHSRQRRTGAVGVHVEHRLGRPRLHHHDADRVRDHVVHLAGDSRALVGHGGPRLLLALGLEQQGPLLELAGAERPPG